MLQERKNACYKSSLDQSEELLWYLLLLIGASKYLIVFTESVVRASNGSRLDPGISVLGDGFAKSFIKLLSLYFQSETDA